MSKYLIEISKFDNYTREDIQNYRKTNDNQTYKGLLCNLSRYCIKWKKILQCSIDENARRECDNIVSYLINNFSMDGFKVYIRKIINWDKSRIKNERF